MDTRDKACLAPSLLLGSPSLLQIQHSCSWSSCLFLALPVLSSESVNLRAKGRPVPVQRQRKVSAVLFPIHGRGEALVGREENQHVERSGDEWEESLGTGSTPPWFPGSWSSCVLFLLWFGSSNFSRLWEAHKSPYLLKPVWSGFPLLITNIFSCKWLN